MTEESSLFPDADPMGKPIGEDEVLREERPRLKREEARYSSVVAAVKLAREWFEREEHVAMADAMADALDLVEADFAEVNVRDAGLSGHPCDGGSGELGAHHIEQGVKPSLGLCLVGCGDDDGDLQVTNVPGERVPSHTDKIQPAVSKVKGGTKASSLLDAETIRLAIWGNVAGEEAREADDALSRISVQAQRVAGLEKALADECANSLRLARGE